VSKAVSYGSEETGREERGEKRVEENRGEPMMVPRI